MEYSVYEKNILENKYRNLADYPQKRIKDPIKHIWW